MELTKKKVLIIGGVLLLVLVLIVVLVLVLRKKKSPSNVEVKFEMIGPNIDRSTTVSLTGNEIEGIDIGDLVEKVLSKSHLSPWKEVFIFWESISVNGKIVDISEGKISEKDFGKKVGKFIGTIPEKISIKAEFRHTCSKDDLAKVEATCDPCKGEKAICTETGPVCSPNQFCPDKDTLKKCCADPSKPLAVCDPKTHQISCIVCPEDKKPDCGDPGCKGIGPVCTADGWVCSPGQVCPTSDSLEKCCTQPGEYATCKNGQVYCSKCKGDPPSCPADCHGSGLVCSDDGSWTCEKGVKCPSSDILDKCCDPNSDTPFAVCENGKVSCTDCGGLPKPDPESCPESCNGQGWKCTSKGWVCTPGMKCPTGKALQDLNCCDSGYTPYCTDNNCIACKCPNGQTACGNIPNCLTTNGAKPDKCCDNGVPCSKNPLGVAMCCAQEQACDNECCPPETICKNGKCVAKCGVDSSGNPFTCEEGSTCVMISNIDMAQQEKIKQNHPEARYDENTQTLYLCDNDQKKCTFTSDEEVVVPSAIANYYPCYPFPSKDPADGIGYCVGKQDTDTLQCSKLGTKDLCDKEEKTNGLCEWRDVLKYMSEGTDYNSLKQKSEQIQRDMGYIQNSWNGDFCQNNDESYQRVISFAKEGGTCTWQDCISQIAQPGIVDVEYNENTGTCVALQACGDISNVGMKNQIVGDDGKIVNNPGVVHTSNSNVPFLSCSNTTVEQCKNYINNSTRYTCNTNTGVLENPPIWIPQRQGVIQPFCTILTNPVPSLDGYQSKEICEHEDIIHTGGLPTLPFNQTFSQGLKIYSPNKKIMALFQPDGNFVVYDISTNCTPMENCRVVWSSHTYWHYPRGNLPGKTLIWQTDGNLIIRDKNNVVVWDTGGRDLNLKPYKLVLQNDSNLVIYDKNNNPAWASLN